MTESRREERKAKAWPAFAAIAAFLVILAAMTGICGTYHLLSSAKAGDWPALAQLTETYLKTENLCLEQTAQNGDYMAALWTDAAGEWIMCEYERDQILQDRWKPKGSKAARPGEISSWNYAGPRHEAVVIVFGVELDDAVGGYVLRAQRRSVEDGRVLNVHVYPNSWDISYIPLPLDWEGKLLAADG